MNDDFRATLQNFVDMVIEYPEQTIDESFRRSGLVRYFEAAQSEQKDTKVCVPGKHKLFKSEEIWLFCPECGQRL